ncbi:ABC transporter substrate-binding protein [bacterium]|nr:ABC transporter substrate-binding protein [bacterium]
MNWSTGMKTVAILSLAFLCSSCEPDKNLVKKRLAYQQENTGNILIGVNWPFSALDDHFREGLLLAQEEINEAGGVLGRKIVLDIHDNGGDKNRARKIAREFAKNRKMAAVIGHAYSRITVETSVIYEEAGLLCLSPRSQLSTLTQHDLDLFFRTSPSNRELGDAAAKYTSLLNFREPVVIMASDEYSKELASYYQTNLARRGIEVVYTFYYFPWNTDYRAIINEMNHMHHDIIFVSMDGDEVADFASKARSLGENAPIMVINNTTDDFIEHDSAAANNSYNIAYFNPNVETESVTQFMEAYAQRFDAKPDNWAAKGYDTLKLYADMVKETGSANAFEVAANLRYLTGWEGVSGTYDFSREGDVHVSPLFVESVQDGKITYRGVDEFHQPTLAEKVAGVCENEIRRGLAEVNVNKNILSVALAESLLFGDQLTSLSFEGRTILGSIAAAFLADTHAHSLHVLGQIDYETIILEERIGSHTDSEVAELRSMAVGSYLISQGINSKEIVVAGANVENTIPEHIIPETSRIQGNRIEVLFVHDVDLKQSINNPPSGN